MNNPVERRGAEYVYKPDPPHSQGGLAARSEDLGDDLLNGVETEGVSERESQDARSSGTDDDSDGRGFHSGGVRKTSESAASG